MSYRHLSVLCWTLIGIVTLPIDAQNRSEFRAIRDGSKPTDNRLADLQTLNGYFPFQHVGSLDTWQRRSELVRRHVQVATGLWPPPTKSPMNAVIHGLVDRDFYTVERVYLESFPGHYVTGSLYRPKGGTGKRPAVLTPHGHWSNGRFYDAGRNGVIREISNGAERFEIGGRYPLQARCVQLARMGCVVFHYDMVGYADSVQLSHRPGVRDQMNTEKEWGYFSPQAELRMQNMMGLQTWNSIRSLDFLGSLPDVDPARIAVTGASGGGTQTFVLAAVDPRPAVLFPAVMVSTAMQGGCTCENASYLRTQAGNIDIAALAAPRPLALTGADDWTKEIATKGFPDLRSLYKMLGAPNNVQVTPLIHFGHNYNSVSRTAMYNWVNRHLKLGFKEPIIETEYVPLSKEELTVWTGKHKKPSGQKSGNVHERELVAWIDEDSRRQIDRLEPVDTESLKEFRRVIGSAFDVMLGRRYGDAGQIVFELSTKVEKTDYLIMTGTLTMPQHKEQLPAMFFYPSGPWNKKVVVWLTDDGKAGLLTKDGQARSSILQLLAKGYALAGVDLFGQGEFSDQKLKHQRLVNTGSDTWKKYAGYTFGYNDSLFTQRVHDALTIIEYILTNENGTEEVCVIGIGKEAGAIAIAASAQSNGKIARTAVDFKGFDFKSVNRFDDPMFLPGVLKYGGLSSLVKLSAPTHILMTECDAASDAKAAYQVSGNDGNLVAVSPKRFESRLVEWISN